MAGRICVRRISDLGTQDNYSRLDFALLLVVPDCRRLAAERDLRRRRHRPDEKRLNECRKRSAENCYIEEGARAFLEKRKPRYTPRA